MNGWERAMEFFEVVYNVSFVMQLATLAVSLMVVFYPFQKTRRSWLIAAAHFAALFAATTLINWALFALSTVWRWLHGINFLLSWLFVVGGYTALYRRNLTGSVIMSCTLYVLIIAIGDFSRDFARLINGTSSPITSIVWYFVIVGLSFVLRFFPLNRYDNIPVIAGILMALNAVCLSALVYVATVIDVAGLGATTGPNAYYLVSCFLFCIISVSSYLLTYFNCQKNKETSELLLTRKLREADKQTLAVSRQAIAEMHALRHDIKNEFSVMRIMLQEKRYDDLNNYFASMTDSFFRRNGSAFIDCGNQLINSVINMEMLKANSYGIQLVTRIKVPPELPFEDSDLCRMIVNLLDNAMEAIVRAKNKAYLVDCKIMKQRDFLYIGVQNEVRDGLDKKKLLKFETEKENSSKHGFGHRIVRRLAQKYNGYASFTIENSQFLAEIMLDCSSGQE